MQSNKKKRREEGIAKRPLCSWQTLGSGSCFPRPCWVRSQICMECTELSAKHGLRFLQDMYKGSYEDGTLRHDSPYVYSTHSSKTKVPFTVQYKRIQELKRQLYNHFSLIIRQLRSTSVVQGSPNPARPYTCWALSTRGASLAAAGGCAPRHSGKTRSVCRIKGLISWDVCTKADFLLGQAASCHSRCCSGWHRRCLGPAFPARLGKAAQRKLFETLWNATYSQVCCCSEMTRGCPKPVLGKVTSSLLPALSASPRIVSDERAISKATESKGRKDFSLHPVQT